MVFAPLTTVPLLPLQADAAIDALLNGPLGTTLEFAVAIIVLALLIGSLVAGAAAGLANLSQDSKRQASASTWVIASIVCLLAAGFVVVGPEVFSALGFDAADNLSILG